MKTTLVFALSLITLLPYLYAEISLYEKYFLQITQSGYERQIKEDHKLPEKLSLQDRQKVQNILKLRLGMLIRYVQEQAQDKKYTIEDLGGFLVVAMVSKHGILDGTFKNMPLAKELFEIVSQSTWSDSYRLIAERSLASCD